MSRTIIAAGGGGFSMNPSGTATALDAFVLERTGKARPRVCFLPTASGDSASYVARFYRAFSRLDCIPTDLTIIESALPRQPESPYDFAGFLDDQDVIYAGGGNTANALAIWRVQELSGELRKAWERGAILCGISAGMVCWFENAVTDSFGSLDPLDDGLGLLPGSACPHYDNDTRRRPTFHRLVKDNDLPAGYAADDGAALVFDGTKLAEVVSERDGAAAYRVALDASGNVVEQRIDPRPL
jgi:dipeptidase E